MRRTYLKAWGTGDPGGVRVRRTEAVASIQKVLIRGGARASRTSMSICGETHFHADPGRTHFPYR